MYVWQYCTTLPNLNPQIVLKILFAAKLPNLLTANIFGYTVSLLDAGYRRTPPMDTLMTELATPWIYNIINLIKAIPQDMLIIGFSVVFLCPPQAKLQEGVLWVWLVTTSRLLTLSITIILSKKSLVVIGLTHLS